MDELVLIVTMPDGKERCGYAFRGRIVAGRDEGCDLKLPDRMVSRRHAEFSLRKDGSILIRDLKSSNGTIVDGHRLEGSEVIVHGDAQVQVGPYAIHASSATDGDEATMLGSIDPEGTQLG